jgi:hypothetical protein
MPVFETRKFRDLAAALMLLAGVTHVAQLWLYALSGTTVLAALLGMFYFLIALGLAGRSRFSLWVGVMIPGLGAAAGLQFYLSRPPVELTLLNVCINSLVVILCAYTLFRTRHAEMD